MKLFLADGTEINGTSFGADVSALGEVVFTTGMTGYLETLTDPSYYGQIVVFTFPLIGNYGVFEREMFSQSAENVDKVYESEKIWVKGVVLAEHSDNPSHELNKSKFAEWLKSQNVPALSGVDTRSLTQVLREHGTMMGSISKEKLASYEDPLAGNYVPEVSPKEITVLRPGPGDQNRIGDGKVIAFVDCGAKNGIFREFLKRGVTVLRVPFDVNPYEADLPLDFQGIFFSNGPGDPETVKETIETMKMCLTKDKPVFGICLGCQMMALGAGGATVKLKYGHRGVNQPVQEVFAEKDLGNKGSGTSGKCLITTQNHGFAVDEQNLGSGFEISFKNLNDGTVEGIKHVTKPFSSVQFHPEACAGPEDAHYLFDAFISQL